MNEKHLGIKFDGQGGTGELKPRWELIPWDEVEQVAKVLTAGAIKYDDDNWKYVKPRQRYVGAMFRHFMKYWRGEEYDEDIYKKSGYKVSHMACLVTNALFLMWFESNPESGNKE